MIYLREILAVIRSDTIIYTRNVKSVLMVLKLYRIELEKRGT